MEQLPNQARTKGTHPLTFQLHADVTQRVYYLSLEFLMGRTLDNAVLNLDVKPTFESAVQKLGFVRFYPVIDRC
jgi:glucan phosphorylase